MLHDKKILVTGATGQIGWPIAERLASDNEVWCAARFTNPLAKEKIEGLGIRTVPWTLGDEDFSAIPSDFTHVVHAAAVMTEPSHDEAIRANAEGTGLLMQHVRGVEAFLFVSSFGVYARQEPTHEYIETDALGGTATYASSYPVSKIATEGTVRAVARMLEIPTTIARMNIGYGAASHGGVPVMFFSLMRKGKPVPVPIGHQNWGSPISERDIAQQASGPLFDIASTPATLLNWAGNDAVSHREMCDYIGNITGQTPNYVESEITFDSFISENTRRKALIGECSVAWRDGIREVIEARWPGSVKN